MATKGADQTEKQQGVTGNGAGVVGGFARGKASELSRWGFLESLSQTIDDSLALGRLGTAIGTPVSKIIKPGKVKDLLSGTWLGHPVHPVLTDIPIGAWAASLIFDIFGGKRLRPASDALVGLGIAAAVPTAITGLSDLADVSEDEGLNMGAIHAVSNSAALVCYGASYAARRRGSRGTGIGLALAGGAFLTAGGYFGGHLSYRRGIGVDQNAFHHPLEDWTPVMDESQLTEGRPEKVDVEGRDVLIYRSEGKLCALANRCSHRGGPLNEGEFHDGTVTCPWHASTFRLEDGSIVNGPATAPQPAYEARINEGRVELRSRS